MSVCTALGGLLAVIARRGTKPPHKENFTSSDKFLGAGAAQVFICKEGGKASLAPKEKFTSSEKNRTGVLQLKFNP